MNNIRNSDTTARAKINRNRRKSGLLTLFVLIFTVPLLFWLVTHGWPGETGFLFFIGYIVYFSIANKNDVCPKCGHGISMLPTENNLRIPELSRSIRACPFCGEDFSYHEPDIQKSKKKDE